MHGKLQLDDNCFEVEAQKKGRKVGVHLDGKDWLVELEPSEEGFHVRLGEHTFDIEVTPEQKDHLCLSRHTDISVDGHLFEVQFHPQRVTNGAEQATLDGGGAQDEGSVAALMPGTIFKMLVEAGQEVQAGDILLILEAMKMENEIKAPTSGVVEIIAVAEGKSVAKGDLLVQIGTGESEESTQ